MGSNVTTIGNNAGKPLATFTSVGQDTGPLFIIYGAVPYGETQGPALSSEILGVKNIIFQLLNPGTNWSIQLFATTDPATAYGTGNNWEPVPSPSTEAQNQFNNPLTSAPGQRLCKVGDGYISFRAVASALPGQTPTGTPTLCAFAVF